jgi:hypothetical protein
MLRLRLAAVILSLPGFYSLNAQSDFSSAKWMDLMRAPKPNYYEVKSAFDAWWKDSVPERGYGYKVFKRWEWRVQDLLDANGYVQYGEREIPGVSGGSGELQTDAAPCPQNGRWVPVGPVKYPWNQSGQPTGNGRINGIGIHPADSNTFFACAPQGGVWKTTDHGRSWEHIFRSESGFATIGASCIALSPNNPDTMYVGTGDRDAGDAPGYGVIASWNGGKTWALRNTGMGNVTVGRIVMHPRNSAILLAASNNGIYRSTNSGASWTQVQTGSTWDLAFHPANPSIVYATILGSFYRSSNGGLTFALITAGYPTTGLNRAQLAVTPAGRNYVYVLISRGSNFTGVYRSIDSGLSFNTMSTAPNILGYYDGTAATGDLTNGQGWYDLDLVADPKDRDRIYVAGINIWRSANGGSTWTQVGHWFGGYGGDDLHADQHALEFNLSGNTLIAGNDGGIYYSGKPRGNAVRWTNISSGIQNSQVYRMAQAQTREFTATHGYQDNGSSQTEKDAFITYYGGDGMDCQIDPTDHRYVYGSYVYGRIYRAIDRNNAPTVGANGTGGINEGGNWLTPFVLQEGNPGTMFAGYQNVWRSNNVKTGSPATWTRLSTGFGGVRHLENSPANNRILYVLQNNRNMQRSDNAMAATPLWTNLGTGPGGVNWVEAHPKDSQRVYCVNNGTLYRSVNKGVSWTIIRSINTAQNGAFKCLLVDSSAPYETIYAGTERGVYVWDSLSGTFNSFNTGFPLWADVTDIEMYYAPEGREHNRLQVSTYGRGMWRSVPWEGGILKPKAQAYVFDSVFTTGGMLRLYERSLRSASSLRWIITPRDAFDFAEGTDSTHSNPVLALRREGLISVILVASNCQGSDTFTRKNWIRVFPKAPAAACNTTTNEYSQSVAIGLYRFQLAGQAVETGGYLDDGATLDLSGEKVFSLRPATTYTARIRTGLYNVEYSALFADYNNNGIFEAWKGEAVYIAPTAVLGERTFSFTTPANMARNKGFRLRAVSDFNRLDTQACRNLSYGQSEDYSAVWDKPQALFYATDSSICQYQSTVFVDSSEGMVSQRFWDFGSGAVPATASGAGPHRVVYTTPGLKTVKLRVDGPDSLVLTNFIEVRRKPVANLSLTGPNPVCEGTPITLVGTDTGNRKTVEWSWLKNQLPIAGVADSVLRYGYPRLADSGEYAVRMLADGCADTSNAIRIKVWPKPIAGFRVNQLTSCLNGNRFNFTDTSKVSSGSIPSLRWHFGDSTMAVIATPVHSYRWHGSKPVRLVVRSNLGCMDSLTRVLTIHPDPVAELSLAPLAQCMNYHSFRPVNRSRIASGTMLYSWDLGDGRQLNQATPVFSYSQPGQYKAVLTAVSGFACADTQSVLLTIWPSPDAAFEVDGTTQCFNEHLFSTRNKSNISAGSLAFLWQLGNGLTDTASNLSYRYSAAGTYQLRLIATGDHGCKDSSASFLQVRPSPRAAFAPASLNPCEGDTFVYYNTSVGDERPLQFEWSAPGRSSNDSIWKTSFNTFGDKDIRLVVTSAGNCRDTAEIRQRIHALPLPGFGIFPGAGCAENTAFSLQSVATAPDGLALGINWDFGDGYNAAGPQVAHRYQSAGNYRITQRVNTLYCESAIFRTLNVAPPVSAGFAIEPMNRETMRFRALDTLRSGVQFTWGAGDGANGTGKLFTHRFEDNGIFTARLIAMTPEGCRDTFLQNFTLNSPALRRIANDFDFYAWPNPTQNRLSYKFKTSSNEAVEVTLFDMLGQDPLWKTTHNSQSGVTQNGIIEMGSLQISAGQYVLRIRSGSRQEQVKVVYVP